MKMSRRRIGGSIFPKLGNFPVAHDSQQRICWGKERPGELTSFKHMPTPGASVEIDSLNKKQGAHSSIDHLHNSFLHTADCREIGYEKSGQS